MLPEIEEIAHKYCDNKRGGNWLIQTIINSQDSDGLYIRTIIEHGLIEITKNLSSSLFAIRMLKKIRDEQFVYFKYNIVKEKWPNMIVYNMNNRYDETVAYVQLRIIPILSP